MLQIGLDKSVETPSHSEPSSNSKKKKNYMQLQDSNAIIKLKTKGSRFVLSKLYPTYTIGHNSLLLEYISDKEIRLFLEDLNKTIAQYWPPQKVIMLSYMLIPFSCGFSLLCPYFCFDNAEKYVQWKLDEYNIKWESKGLKLHWDDDEMQIHLFNKKNNKDDDYHEIDVIIE